MLNTAAPLAAYVLASVSFPFWIARAAGVDLRRAGSRKLGGGNLYQTVGPRAGVVGGLLDALKGFVAVLAGRRLGLGRRAQLACGVAAVAGQMWPVFHRFDGGRANATGWGFLLAAGPRPAAAAALPLAAGLGLRQLVRPRPSRVMPVAALASFAVWPAVILVREGPSPRLAAGAAVLTLILVRRLTAGLREDLATGAPARRVLLNRALFDRSELQERGLVPL